MSCRIRCNKRNRDCSGRSRTSCIASACGRRDAWPIQKYCSGRIREGDSQKQGRNAKGEGALCHAQRHLAPRGHADDSLTLLFSMRTFYLALALVLLTTATRLPALLHPRPIDDEAVYSVVANEIVDGGRPYVDAIERKPPMLFWTYAAVFAVAGKYNWVALHMVALLWTLATMAGLYFITHRLFNPKAGLIAALLYSVFQPWGTGLDLALNGELLMNLPVVWAWAIVLNQSKSRLRFELLLAGSLLCCGFLLKQPAAIAAVPAGLYLLFPSYRRSRNLTLVDSLVQAALLTFGFAATLGLVISVLQRQGILQEAFYWTVQNHTVPMIFWRVGVGHTLAFVATCLPLIIGAALSLRDKSGLWADKTAERHALFALLLASMIGVSAGARFYPHYYIQLLPPLALLAAPFYGQLSLNKKIPGLWFLRRSVFAAWLAITVIGFSIAHWQYMITHRRPLSATEKYIITHSQPNERIFVWGRSAAKFYLRTKRRPASRYVLTFPLTGLIFGGEVHGIDTRDRIVPGSWSALEDDFRRHPPAYIIDFDSGPAGQYPSRDFPFLNRYLTEDCDLVAQTAEGTIYHRR
jgi:4-amino-4-deoxy-L-arabinose transferase-like glycosyltransferase